MKVLTTRLESSRSLLSPRFEVCGCHVRSRVPHATKHDFLIQMYDSEVQNQQSAFKVVEKAFKSCLTVEDALGLGAIDFQDFSSLQGVSSTHEKRILLGREVSVYRIDTYPGLSVIKGSLSRKAQVELAHHSLSESLSPPSWLLPPPSLLLPSLLLAPPRPPLLLA